MRPGLGRPARGPRLALAVLTTAAAGAVGMLLAAGPAHADTSAVAPPGISGLPPGPMGGPITVTWAATSLEIMKESMAITWTRPANPPSGISAPSSGTVTVPVAGSCSLGIPAPTNCTYQWPTELMSANGYVYNSTYTVTASADDCPIARPCTPVSVTNTVAVANAPGVPTGVTAVRIKNNAQVSLTWDARPEPDIVAYEVFRDKTSVVKQYVTPANPATSFTDIPHTDGTYRYTVKAYRYGATYDSNVAGPSSPPTGPQTLTGTAANPTTTTSTTKPGGGLSTLPPGFTARPSPGHASLNATPPGGGVALAPTAPTTVDPGFNPTLPYAQPQTSTPGTTDPAVIASPPVHKAGNSVGAIAAVGAGLLVAVIALHGLWLRSEVRRPATLEAIDPDH